MLPWPNVLDKWADRLGQVHCQYGTVAKLRTSCPCEVEFEVGEEMKVVKMFRLTSMAENGKV